MKLIIAGSTGFAATEIIRQALYNPSITTLLALGRRETPVPPTPGKTHPNYNPSKLKSVVCNDFTNYSDEVKKELAGADACIWTIAITPSKSNAMPFEEVQKICVDYTDVGIKTISPIANKPFRFIYMSGAKTERDPEIAKKAWIMRDYGLLRSKAENLVLDYAKDSNGAVEICIARPGLIDAPGKFGMVQAAALTVFRAMIGLPLVENKHVAATLLEYAVKGIEKETLLNEDLVRIGEKVLEEGDV